jgi:glycosyltransferase involved in cell wall biosynthesis
MDDRAAAASIVFLNRFYWPDVAATGQMLSDLAEDLAADGWRVTVITSAGVYDGRRGALPREEERNGVRILRAGGTRFGRHGLAGRVFDYLSYLGGALLRLLRVGRADLVVAMSDPPLLPTLGVLTRWRTRARLVYWVQDLFPEIAGRLGVLDPAGLVYRAASAFARWLHRRCDLVIALGPRMARALVAAGARPERTTFVDNWADAAAIRPLAPEDNSFLGEHGLRGRFVVLYSGNAGRAHVFDAVMQAADLLRDQTEILFLFIGGGQRIPELRATVERERLPNVRFLDYLPREELSRSLSSATVALVTEDPGVEGLLVPSKTYGILASGRPILFVGSPESDVARVVDEAECGVIADPDDGATLARVILGLRSEPARLARMGANARRAAEERYDRRHATRRWGMAAQTLLTGARVIRPTDRRPAQPGIDTR